jgi:hypothetical protein
MTDINRIDKNSRTVYYDDGTNISYHGFIDKFRVFMKNRIAGESLYPADMERFMRRTSGKNLSQLMKGKKMEGYFEGVSDKMLTRGQKIALGTIITIIFVGLIIYIILKNQGMIP